MFTFRCSRTPFTNTNTNTNTNMFQRTGLQRTGFKEDCKKSTCSKKGQIQSELSGVQSEHSCGPFLNMVIFFFWISIDIHWWIFRSMAISIHGYHRFFFFVPETLNPIFLGKSKKTRAGKWSRSVFSKVNLEPCDAIWCQFGSQFSSPKNNEFELEFRLFVPPGQYCPGTTKKRKSSNCEF